MRRICRSCSISNEGCPDSYGEAYSSWTLSINSLTSSATLTLDQSLGDCPEYVKILEYASSNWESYGDAGKASDCLIKAAKAVRFFPKYYLFLL